MLNKNELLKPNTANDTLRERYVFGADFTGDFDFPILPQIKVNFDGLKPVAFPQAKSEKRPRESICHFFVNDYAFERLWNNAEKHVDYLSNFKYVCSPDFSLYNDMSLTLQLYNVYRSRALGYYLTTWGMKVIPTVTWGNEKTFDFCFDGLPQNSTLAVSTNGCFFQEGKEAYTNGFREMCKRLNPFNVLVIGREIPVDVDVEIVYMKSFGQEMTERLRGYNDGRS